MVFLVIALTGSSLGTSPMEISGPWVSSNRSLSLDSLAFVFLGLVVVFDPVSYWSLSVVENDGAGNSDQRTVPRAADRSCHQRQCHRQCVQQLARTIPHLLVTTALPSFLLLPLPCPALLCSALLAWISFVFVSYIISCCNHADIPKMNSHLNSFCSKLRCHGK